MADRVTCAATSRACGEAVLGTASRARRWLLVEQPGAWGVEAITESGLPPEVSRHLHLVAAEVPCRVLLLRRTGGQGVEGGGTRRVVYAGISRVGGGGWLEQVSLDDPHELLDLDLAPLADGASIGGTPLPDPLYLVCTNGRHDPCCAEYGMPVARALAERFADRVWECSHIGGDRFAANLVCLPDGVFYGRLDPPTALQAVEAHERGTVLLAHLRGRSPLPFPVQAAEILVRREHAGDDLDGLRVTAHERTHAGTHRVTFALPDGSVALATVSVHPSSGSARPITCATAPTRPPTFRLDDLTVRRAPDEDRRATGTDVR